MWATKGMLRMTTGAPLVPGAPKPWKRRPKDDAGEEEHDGKHRGEAPLAGARQEQHLALQ